MKLTEASSSIPSASSRPARSCPTLVGTRTVYHRSCSGSRCCRVCPRPWRYGGRGVVSSHSTYTGQSPPACVVASAPSLSPTVCRRTAATIEHSRSTSHKIKNKRNQFRSVPIYLYYKWGDLYLCSAKAPVLQGSGSRRVYRRKGTSVDRVYVCL